MTVDSAAEEAVSSVGQGLSTLAAWTTTPVAAAFFLSAAFLWWLGMVEVELMNRYGAKPDIERH